MSRCTEHTRKKKGGATCCVCRMAIVPGERYRQRIFIGEDYTEHDYERKIAHSCCVYDCEGWRLFEDPPPWKPPKPAKGVTVEEHRTLLHCLGMGEHIDRQYHGSRHSGYFADGSKVPESLVAKGMMARTEKGWDDKHRYYLVTTAGGAAVGRPDLGVSP